MPISASTVTEDMAQKDGRRSIRERHIDHLGQVYFFTYLTEAGALASAQLAGHAAQLITDLTNVEIDTNEQRALQQLSPVFNYSTVAQLRTRLRQRFGEYASWDLVRLGKFISGLGLSDVQLTNLFGVSGAQLTALKNKLSSLAGKYDDILSQQGQ